MDEQKKTRGEHAWVCHGCGQRRPYKGFDRARLLCAGCQGLDRQAILKKVAAKLDQIPPWLMRRLLKCVE